MLTKQISVWNALRQSMVLQDMIFASLLCKKELQRLTPDGKNCILYKVGFFCFRCRKVWYKACSVTEERMQKRARNEAGYGEEKTGVSG